MSCPGWFDMELPNVMLKRNRFLNAFKGFGKEYKHIELALLLNLIKKCFIS